MSEYTPEKVADLIAETRGWLNDHRHFHSAKRSHVRLLADALEAVSAERDEALAVIAEAMCVLSSVHQRPGSHGEMAKMILSRIPEHPKED